VKAFTVRLDAEQHADLVRLARERRTTISALVREAIDDRVRASLSDPELRSKLDQIQADDRAAVERHPPSSP